VLKRTTVSALIVIVLGTLLHFVWEWSGRHPVVALFGATNESVWEHLKLAFWPAAALAPLQRALYGRPKGWIVATALRTLLPGLLIVAIFYAYTAIAGNNVLVLDIATFVIAVCAGETAGHALMARRLPRAANALAAVAVMLALAAFAAFTFRPPSHFLFEVPAAVHRSGFAS
jgi:hypothetical protein